MATLGGIINTIIFGIDYLWRPENAYILVIGLLPLIFGFYMSKRADSPIKESLNIFATGASIIAGIILINRLYVHLNIPASFIFLTVPSIVITISLFISPGPKEKELNVFAFILCLV